MGRFGNRKENDPQPQLTSVPSVVRTSRIANLFSESGAKSPENTDGKERTDGKVEELRPKEFPDAEVSQMSTKKDGNRAVSNSQQLEAQSRMARRNSIKRSVSRKIARSESRRQLLNIRDDTTNVLRRTPSMMLASERIADRRGSPRGMDREKMKSGENVKLDRLTTRPSCGRLPGGKERLKPANNSLKRMESIHQVVVASIIDDDLELECDDFEDFDVEVVISEESGQKQEEKTKQSSSHALATSQTKVVKQTKIRKRPPPLLNGVGERKASPDSGTDWPSGNFFESDGGFATGGFRITTEGILGQPCLVTREDSDQNDGDAPQSSRNLVVVRSLKELKPGPTIGAGAAGRVYIAEHIPSRRTMAMKVVNVYEREKRNQLMKELETLATYVSRHLVRFYGAFYDGSGAVHIALEYMDQGCLSSCIQRTGPIPEEIVRIIAFDCLRGLRFLHRHHVLHRDFKTANILLSRRLCCAKLSDFGLARDMNEGVSRVDTFVGTVAYMSPERLHGGKYTYASDIWALGVSLVECLLGKYPFNRPQNYFDYIDATEASDILHVLDRREAQISQKAKNFISLCTQSEPSKRPDAITLLKHPWICGIKRDIKLFASWLDQQPKANQNMKTNKP